MKANQNWHLSYLRMNYLWKEQYTEDKQMTTDDVHIKSCISYARGCLEECLSTYRSPNLFIFRKQIWPLCKQINLFFGSSLERIISLLKLLFKAIEIERNLLMIKILLYSYLGHVTNICWQVFLPLGL